MLYKRKNEKKLDLTLFKNPTSEYRATPFWAWNCELNQTELEWQLDVFKKMGFGGAHMHVRTGMATPYLSDEYMEHIKNCVNKIKNENMLAWLYDEDRWPSGAAGGIVTQDRQFRAKYLLITPYSYGSKEAVKKPTKNTATVRPGREENGILLACYDVELDSNGYLMSWSVIGEHEEAMYTKWYVYMEELGEISWWNGQTYINSLDKKAIDRFIQVTYETYNRTISEEFDKTVPAIFTDEPQFPRKATLKYATEKTDIIIPWTDDLPNSYASVYEGEDIIANIPELIWERADKVPSVIRYHYHDHVCERFVQAFADNCGDWCKEHGIELTGHVMEEPTLDSQTGALGEAMRNYRGFGIPGIDMLCGNFEFTTAKQAQSAVHQYGREGMLSELYGVTGWDFDFRGHKLHGDWQAALGVTVRVPHLSWVSMGGEAKRDYPASIHYQSPWWEKYSLVEDHFARLNTAMTRGKAEVKVGVIHPIESYWLHFGPSDQTALVRENLDENFQNITKWLLFGGVDFDFISESLLPDLCREPSAPLKVGEMEYEMILVPGCETLRSTTLERLEEFVKAGGKLVFVGDVPTLEDARVSERGRVLAEQAKVVQFNKGSVLAAVEDVRFVELRNETGAMTKNLLHQIRKDGDGKWLFIAQGAEPRNKHISEKQEIVIRVKGTWKATIYNTMTGEQEDAKQSQKGDVTEVYQTMYDYDSLLLWLEPVTANVVNEVVTGSLGQQSNHTEYNTSTQTEKGLAVKRNITLPDYVDYTLSEPNALLLNMAEYALDGGEWHAKEELLRLDVECRKMLGWSTDIAHVAQPWSLGEETEFHRVSLKFQIESAIEYREAHLAVEKAGDVSLKWNGKEVNNQVVDWYVDKAIQTIALPKIEQGENILEIEVPIGKRTMIEWMYLLGDFGVEVLGKNTRIIEKRDKLAFGDVTVQGLPFYTGNITYHIPIETEGDNVSIRSGFYVGAMQEVSIDGKDAVPMIYPPYTATLGAVEAGKHTLDLTLYGNRYNGFGALHLADEKHYFHGPNAWRTEGDSWCYEYMLRKMGVLACPVITENI